MTDGQLVLFDYAALDPETRIVVQQRTGEIKTLMRRTAQDIIDIGQKLIEVRAQLSKNGNGTYKAWLHVEFDWSYETARNFIRVAERFNGVNFTATDFAPSALYLLAAPSTPDDARQEALDRAAMGEMITHRTAKQIVEAHTVLAAAALDTQDPPRLAINAALEVLEEYHATGGYVTLDDGDQVEADEPDALIDATRAAYEERAARQSQHIQDSVAKRNGMEHVNAGEEDQTSAYDGNEWYTPARYIAAARELMGTIDLDPASCAYAQQTVQAGQFYTKDDDGLLYDWTGRVWLNPPYSYPEVERFTQHLIHQYEAGITQEAILLVNNCTDAAWFQQLLQRYPVCFTAGRIRFERPDFEKFATRQGQAFFYLGTNETRFSEIFAEFGVVLWRLA